MQELIRNLVVDYEVTPKMKTNGSNLEEIQASIKYVRMSTHKT
jgi:hypothetical protein